LERTGVVKNMQLCALPAIFIPDNKHIRLKPRDWLDQVVIPLAEEANLARSHTASVSTLVLGPKERMDRMIELIHDRAVNRNASEVHVPLAERAQERKAILMNPNGPIDNVMNGSIAEIADAKRLGWVCGKMMKEEGKWSKALA